MLRWISKSGTTLQFAIFTVLLVLLWVPAIVHPLPPVYTSTDGPLYKLFADWLQDFPIATVSSAMVLVVLQSFLVFFVFQDNGFFGRSNFLPAILILLAYSWNSNFQTMHAALTAGIFIVIALRSIMFAYGRQGAYHQVFSAGFSISIASLFYIPLAYLLLLIWFSLITFRISTWREYLISIIGFVLPFVYYLSWLYWNDNLANGLHILSTSLFNIILPAKLSSINTLWLIASGFVMIITMMVTLNAMSDKLISLRRRAWIMFNYSLSAVFVVVLSGWPLLSVCYIFVFPLAFFITGSITLPKRPFWFEIFALLYFLLFVIMRLYLLLLNVIF